MGDVMIISPAFAQAAGGGNPGGGLGFIVPMVLIFAIMYFLIIRPQQKRIKEHQEMVEALVRGDTVVTAGGLIGKVVKVTNDDELLVELATDVRVKVVRHTISDVRTKGKPVGDR